MFSAPCTTGFPECRGFTCTLTDDQGPCEAELTIDHGVYEYALIDRDFADDNCFPMFELKEPYLSTFDGGMGSEIVTHATRLHLDICGHEEEVTMPIIRISHLGCHVILGTPWLQQHRFCLQTDFELTYCLEGDSNEEIFTPRTAEDLALMNVINRVRCPLAAEGSGNTLGELPMVSDEVLNKTASNVGDAYLLGPHVVLDKRDDNLDSKSVIKQDQRDLDRTVEVSGILTGSKRCFPPILVLPDSIPVYSSSDPVPRSIRMVYNITPDPISSPDHAPTPIRLAPVPVPAPNSPVYPDSMDPSWTGDFGPSLAPSPATIPAPTFFPPDLPPDPALTPAHSLPLNLHPLPDPPPEQDFIPGPPLNWNSLPDSLLDLDIDSRSLFILDFDPGLTSLPDFPSTLPLEWGPWPKSEFNSDSVPDPSSVLNSLPCLTATPNPPPVIDSVPGSLLGSDILLVPPLVLEPGSGFLSDSAPPPGPLSRLDLVPARSARSLVLGPYLDWHIKSVSLLNEGPAPNPAPDLSSGGPACDPLPIGDCSPDLTSRFNSWHDPPFILFHLPGFPPGQGPVPDLKLAFNPESHAPLDLNLVLDPLFVLNHVPDVLLALDNASGFLRATLSGWDPLSCFHPVPRQCSLGPEPTRPPGLDSMPTPSLGLGSVFDPLLASDLTPGSAFGSNPVPLGSVPDPFLVLDSVPSSSLAFDFAPQSGLGSVPYSLSLSLQIAWNYIGPGHGYCLIHIHIYPYTILPRCRTRKFFSSPTASLGIKMPVSGDLDFRLVRARSFGFDSVSLPLVPFSLERCRFRNSLLFSDPCTCGTGALREEDQPRLGSFHPIVQKHHCQNPALLTLGNEDLQEHGIHFGLKHASRDFGHREGLMSGIWLIQSLRSLYAANPSTSECESSLYGHCTLRTRAHPNPNPTFLYSFFIALCHGHCRTVARRLMIQLAVVTCHTLACH